LSTRRVRKRLVASLTTSCNNAVILSSCYKVDTHNLLTNCWYQVVGTTCNKSNWAQQPCIKLSTSRWQLVNKLGTSSANTSCWQVVGTALLLKYAAGLLQLVRFYVCVCDMHESHAWITQVSLDLAWNNLTQRIWLFTFFKLLKGYFCL
jgi:hypothetical protein